MLVLSRKQDEQIVIDVKPSDVTQRIVITLIEVRGDKVRTGYTADKEFVTVHRREVMDLVDQQRNEGEQQ